MRFWSQPRKTNYLYCRIFDQIIVTHAAPIVKRPPGPYRIDTQLPSFATGRSRSTSVEGPRDLARMMNLHTQVLRELPDESRILLEQPSDKDNIRLSLINKNASV